ncbi:MAG: HlyD family efflux transporter periplasmic adaptor subunit [Verrucomicrobiales bacterium]
MKNIRKYIFRGLILILLAFSIYYGLKEEPVAVDISAVTTGPLQITVDEDGMTVIRDSYIVSAPLSGKLLRLKLEPGDAVAKNSVLAVIDPGEPILLDARTEAEAKARIKAAEANLERAKNQLEVQIAEAEKWQRYAERDEDRLQKRLISAPALEDTRHALRIAQGTVSAGQSALKVSQFELDQARAVLNHGRSQGTSTGEESHFAIQSPIDGVVLRRFKESSALVPAGDPILEVGDPLDLEIRIDVLSQDAIKIQPGQKVLIEQWGGDRDLVAQVRRVEPSAFTKVSALGVEEQRVYIFAHFSEKDRNQVKLGDAYRVGARIIVWENENALRIPSGAIFRQGEAWATYRVVNQRAELRKIEIGKNNGLEAEVLTGLEAGDRVVLHPGDRVESGTLLGERKG